MRAKLQEARKRAGLTQEQVAERLHVTERYYKAIEYGERTGVVELWDKLEDMFNVHQRVLREIGPDKEDNPS